MTIRRRGAVPWVAIALAAGCGGSNLDMAEAPVSTIADSAGVTIVENALPAEAHHVGWSIGSEPVVSIGTLEDDPQYQLFRVVDAAVLDDGRIAVANRGTSEIRFYDPEGGYLDSWGGSGEGPGEFTGLSRISPWRGDSLLTWDSRQRRVTVFDAAGDVGRTFSLASDDRVTTSEFVDVFPDDRMLIRGSFLFSADDIPSGLQRPDRPYGLADATGEIVASLGDHPGAETHALVTPQFVTVTIHPFARRTLEAVWGETILLSPSDRYELTAFDATGSLVRSVRREHAPVEVTDEHMERLVTSRLEAASADSRPRLRQQYADMPLVESFPAFDEVHVDALDHLWVSDYVPPPDDGVRWTIFDPSGRVLGWIELPAGVRVMEIGAEHVLLVHTDDFDVEQVQLWRLDRGAGEDTIG